MKPILALLAAASVAALVQMPGAAWAQSAPGAEDLRALRFYVQQNEAAAIQAEVRRLQSQFPGWAPPADLNDLLTAQSGPTGEIADIYARIARGDIEGMRRTLQRTRARYPSWQVPGDLAAAIELAEAQVTFDRAINTRDGVTAASIGAQTPALFRCDRINNAWNLADLHRAAGSPARALATYRQIVGACTTIPDLVATIEKAETVTSDAELLSLTATAKQRFPNHGSTFDALGQRLLAGRGRGVAAAAAVAAPVAAPVAIQPAAAVSRPAAPAAPAATPVAVAAPAPVAVAPASATMAVTPASIVMAPPTLSSLPRSGDGRLAQASSAARAGAFRECLAYSARPRSLDIAYERAWCAYNLDRPLESLSLFSAAADGGLGGTVQRDARFGMALSFLKRNMTDDAARIAAAIDLTAQQRGEVEVIILDQRGVRAYETGDHQGAVDYFNALEQAQGGLRRDLAMLRGYAFLRLGQRDRARNEFQKLHDVLATEESRTALNDAR